MFGRVAPLAALALLSFPLVTAAGDLKPVPKTGACPPGYYSSGNKENCRTLKFKNAEFEEGD